MIALKGLTQCCCGAAATPVASTMPERGLLPTWWPHKRHASMIHVLIFEFYIIIASTNIACPLAAFGGSMRPS